MDDLARTIEKAIKQIDFVHASQKAQKKLEGLEKDLAAANQIQQFILPSVFPPFPEDSDLLDIYASMEAAKDIGGDFTTSSASAMTTLRWSLAMSAAGVSPLPCLWP